MQLLMSGELKLVAGIDFGVGYSSIDYCTVRPREALTFNSWVAPTSVTFLDSTNTVPMEIGVVQDKLTGKLCVVCETLLKHSLTKGDLLQKDVIVFPKLSLLSGHEQDVLGERDPADERQTKAYSFADSIKRSHDLAMQPLIGKTVEVKLPRANKVVEFKLSGTQVFVDIWLALLVDALIGDIQDSLGGSWEDIENVLSKSVVTVASPESWSDEMNDYLRKSALAANLQNVRIVSEAKSSALAVIFDSSQEAGKADAANAIAALQDSVSMVVDHGAGTLDVTTAYLEPSEKEKLVLRTAFQSTSVLCGAQFLNEIFIEYLPQLLGHPYEELVQKLADNNYDEPRSLAVRMKRTFEEVKQSISATITEPSLLEDAILCYLSQQFIVAGRGRRGILEVPPEVMREIFDRHMKGVFEAIDSQKVLLVKREDLKDKVLHIVCVGGGNRNKYMVQKIKDEYSSKTVKIMKERRDRRAPRSTFRTRY